MSDIFAALAAPFDPADVSWRIGSTTKDKARGMALAYIDARMVQDRLNDVLTPCGWQCEHVLGNDKRITCRIGVSIHVANAVKHRGVVPENPPWIWKSDGAGETDFEGEKGSYSDSFKRAAVKWGVGRYLYDLDTPWVELEADGKRIKQSEYAKLNALLDEHMSFVKLVASAAEQSDKGIEIYKSFYLGLTDAERKSLKPYHEKYKQNAEFVTNHKKAA